LRQIKNAKTVGQQSSALNLVNDHFQTSKQPNVTINIKNDTYLAYNMKINAPLPFEDSLRGEFRNAD
jgi:hypothetical protein